MIDYVKINDMVPKPLNIASGLSLADTSYCDFCIADDDGNVVVEFLDGHVRTNGFDSSAVVSRLGSIEFSDANHISKYLFPWKGKNVVILGDSITDATGYVDVVRELTGANVYNRGVSGTCVAARSGRADSMVERIMKDKNDELNAKSSGMPSSVDVAVVFGGTNDFWWGSADESFGSANTSWDDVNSFCGAYKKILNWFKETYPGAMVLCCTLLKASGHLSGNFTDHTVDASGNFSEALKTFKDGQFSKRSMCDAIKEIACLFGCGVIDLYDECLIDGWSGASRKAFYGSENEFVHPNSEAGKRALGGFIAKKINSIQ